MTCLCDILTRLRMRHPYATIVLAHALLTLVDGQQQCAACRASATVRPIASTPLQPLPPFVRSLVFQLMPSPTSNAVHMSVCVRTRKNRPEDCMAKFVSNKWLGALVFAGIVADKLLLL